MEKLESVLSHLNAVILPVFIIVLCLGTLVQAQETTYPMVVVDHKEIRLVPESLSSLSTSTPAFASEPILANLLSDNDTLFWAALGHTGGDLQPNASVNAFALVQMNHTGFFEFIVGLSLDNETLKWVTSLNSTLAASFATVVQAATDFFANDGRYWGLCEEFIELPGYLVAQNTTFVWRTKFHLVAESERWTLLLDTSGHILDKSFAKLPCKSCSDYTLIAVLGMSGAAFAVFALVLYRTKVTSQRD
jgi:hypothetical protein